MTKDGGVEAVDRALRILSAFRGDESTLGLADIARRTGLYKSTILRIAISLENHGFLVKLDGGRFRLGPAAWHLGATYRRTFRLADLIRPELKALSDTTRETASFYVREGTARVCLFRAEPDRPIRHSIVEGAPMPIETGATGKILLAFSDTPSPGTAPIRSAGFAVSRGERDPDVAAVAVPLHNRSGHFLGALAISGLISRFGPEVELRTREALDLARRRLEPRLAH